MSDNTVQRLIGIDFGTSTSVVRVKRYKNGEPVGDSYSSVGVTFGNGESDTKAVTVVRLNADGSLTCGREALEQTPDSTVYQEFKMDLESTDIGKQARARELTEEYFRYLYQWYDHQHIDLGEADDTETAIVSFPVKWQEETRRFMMNAAMEAGFQNVAAMDEASAALYATLCRKMNDINEKGILRVGEPGYLLLVDMGAGTTDLVVCRYTVDNAEGVVRPEQIKNEIIATWPEDASSPTFGGREVDRVLEDFLTRYIQDCGLPAEMARQLVTGNSSVKPWKENTVSWALNKGNQVESCAFLNGYMMLLPSKKTFPAFGRREFETMLEGRLEQFKVLVAGCLDHATRQEPELLAKGLDLVILTGGHSSWYFAEELLNGAMPGLALPQLERVQGEKARVMRLSNPQETVALGLVYSRLPLTIEDKKREAEEVLKRAREEAFKRMREEAGRKPADSSPDVDRILQEYLIQYLVDCGLPADKARQVVDINQVRAWKEDTVYPLLYAGKTVEYAFLSGYVMLLPNKKPFPAFDKAKFEQMINGTVPEQQPTGQTESPPVVHSSTGYVWDDRLLVKAAHYLSTHANTVSDVKWYKVTAMNQFRSCLNIQPYEEIYLAHDDTLLKSGKNGYAFCKTGIYNRALWSTPQFVSWEEFINAKIEQNWILVLPNARVSIYHTGSMSDKRIKTLIPDLQAYLCQQSMLLQP